MVIVKLRMSLPEGPIGALVEMENDRARTLYELGYVSMVEDGPEPEAVEPESTEDEEELECEVCGFVAKSARGLSTHMRTHEEEG